MKKIILVGLIAFAIGAIISPIAGMAINSTRSLILGMAPEEAILVLADKIDSNNVDNETKITELQSIINDQKAQLEIDQQKIAAQDVKIETVNSAVITTNETVAKQKDCSADVTKYCVSDSFMDANKFKNFLKHYEDFDNYDEYKEKFTKQFNNCQNALKCE